ncbi:hypothetical protein J6Z19_03925 [bacterium]|nr:hypothetical protein [bacterium]
MSDTEQKIKIKGKEFRYTPQRLDRETDIAIDANIAKSNLLLFNSIAKSYNFKFVLFFGTLLGAIREQNFIKNDTDIDVVSKGEEELLNMIPALQGEGFLFIRYYAGEKRVLYSFLRQGVYIDVDIVRNAGKSKYYLAGAKIPSSFVDDLKVVDFIGESFFVPQEYEKIFIMLYGKDWRIPQNKAAYFPLILRRDYMQILIHIIPKKFRNFVKTLLGLNKK